MGILGLKIGWTSGGKPCQACGRKTDVVYHPSLFGPSWCGSCMHLWENGTDPRKTMTPL